MCSVTLECGWVCVCVCAQYMDNECTQLTNSSCLHSHRNFNWIRLFVQCFPNPQCALRAMLLATLQLWCACDGVGVAKNPNTCARCSIPHIHNSSSSSNYAVCHFRYGHLCVYRIMLYVVFGIYFLVMLFSADKGVLNLCITRIYYDTHTLTHRHHTLKTEHSTTNHGGALTVMR